MLSLLTSLIFILSYTCNFSSAVVVMATDGDWESVHTLPARETDQNNGRRKVSGPREWR